MTLIRFIRINRESTDTWMTFVLPEAMEFQKACIWLERHMRGWEVYSGSFDDPDELKEAI